MMSEHRRTIDNPRREIFNDLADGWDERVVLTDAQKATIEAVVRSSGLDSDAAVLDVGCGTGVLAPYILQRLGPRGRLIGIDVSDGMIGKARTKNSDQRALYIRGDVYTYEFADESFDAVFVFSAFPHLHDKPTALGIFHRILKTGGTLVIFHVESSEAINSFHKEHVRSEVLQKDFLPSIETLCGMADRSRWIILESKDEEELYLLRMKKKSP